jgi:hypothetical protein
VRTAWCTLKTFPLKKYAYRIPLETIVHAAYRMPTSGGVTLDFCAQGTGQDFFTSDRKRHYQSETYFSTEKISPTEVTAASFEIPKGLKKAASLREVVSGAEVRREGEEFLIESSKKNK